MATVTITPASGSITAVKTACYVTCATVPNNTVTGYNTANYPGEPQVTYYFKATATGQQTLKSRVFSTNPNGTADWPDVIFPAAGSWTLGVYKTSDDTSVVTTAVTVA